MKNKKYYKIVNYRPVEYTFIAVNPKNKNYFILLDDVNQCVSMYKDQFEKLYETEEDAILALLNMHQESILFWQKHLPKNKLV